MKQTGKVSLFFTRLAQTNVVLRILAGPFIFLSPFWASVASLTLDSFDGELFKRAGYARPIYSLYDKILDYYWYLFTISYIIIENLPFKNLFIFFFLYRSVGQILFLWSRRGLFLFLFPNIFEKFFYLYLIGQIFPAFREQFLQPPEIYITLIVLALFSFYLEVIIHLKQMNFSRFYLGKTSYWPSKTINSAKMLVFFTLAFVIGTGYIYFKYQKTPSAYKTQAEKSSRDGSVLSYDSKGTITGRFPATKNLNYSALLFREPGLKNAVCEGQIHTSDLGEGNFFAFQNNCLADLGNDYYYLLLLPADGSQSFILEFSLENGRLN